MIKERIQEIFDFTKSESPYRKANKGWISQDIFLDINPSSDTLKQKNEAAKVTLLWSPISILLSNIFLILIIGSIIVFTSLSFAKGRFDFNIFNNSLVQDIVKFEGNQNIVKNNQEELYSVNLIIEKNLDSQFIDKPENINSLDDIQSNSDQKIIPNEVDKKETIIKDVESNKDIQILENKKPKSNFI